MDSSIQYGSGELVQPDEPVPVRVCQESLTVGQGAVQFGGTSHSLASCPPT